MNDKKITRARNKTVILTPEMTNQMRNAMSKNLAESSGEWSKPSEGWERPSSSISSGVVQQPVKESFQQPVQPVHQAEQIEQDLNLEFNDFKSEEPNIQPIDVEDSWQAFTETVIEPVEMEPINPFSNYQQENHIEPIAPFTAFESGENLEPLPQIEEEPVMEQILQPVKVQEPAASGNRIQWEVETPIIGFLVSYDDNKNGEFYPLRVGRIAITSVAPENGNCLILKHTSVSEMHAVMKITANARIQILDQLSEQGTKILKTGNEDCIELSGDKAELVHGDVVIFGERQFSVCVIDFGV